MERVNDLMAISTSSVLQHMNKEEEEGVRIEEEPQK